MAPCCVRHVRSDDHVLVARRRDVPQHQIAVARKRFGVGRHHEVGAERERLLQVARGGGVVHGHERALAARGIHQPADVADVEQWVRRRFDPEQLGAVEHRELSVVACGRQARGDAQLREPVRRHHTRGVVRVGRQHHHVAGLEHHAEERRGGRHPRGEAHRLAAVQDAERLFPRRPRGVVEAAIGERMLRRVARRSEGGRELHRRHEGPGRGGPGIAGLENLRVAVHGGLVSAQSMPRRRCGRCGRPRSSAPTGSG